VIGGGKGVIGGGKGVIGGEFGGRRSDRGREGE